LLPAEEKKSKKSKQIEFANPDIFDESTWFWQTIV
jgi:hypothetical protein